MSAAETKQAVRDFAALLSDFEDAACACVPQSSLDYPTAEQREERDRLRGGVVGTYHALLAEVERLQADAARLDWLATYSPASERLWRWVDDPRRAIDAAMVAERSDTAGAA